MHHSFRSRASKGAMPPSGQPTDPRTVPFRVGCYAGERYPEQPQWVERVMTFCPYRVFPGLGLHSAGTCVPIQL